MKLIFLRRTCNILCFIAALFATFPSSAQVDSPTIPPQQIPLPDPEPLPELEPIPPDRELPPLEIPRDRTPDRLVPEDFPEIVFVREFKIVGNTALSPAQLQKVLEPYTNRSLSFSQLQEAALEVTQLYIDNGYVTSGAIVPAQTVSDGVVIIQISEGQISEINITGLDRLRESYVRSRVEIGARSPLNQERLLLALQLLQLDPLIETINAELVAGVDPNISVLNIAVSEADAFNLELALDNQRAPVVGSFRRKVDLEHLNLIGFGDRFTVGYINTEGSNSLDNLGYRIPFNARNGTISFRHNRTDSDLLFLPESLQLANPLDIQTQIIESDLTLLQPLYKTPNREFIVGATGSLADTKSLDFSTDTPLPIANEANEDGETRVSVLRLFQEYIARDRQQVFAIFSQFNVGLDVLDATVNDDFPDSRFFSWRAQGQYLRLLNQQAPFTTLLLRGDFQASNDFLISREQFSLGGFFNVRGYRQNALLGDNGLFLSAELRQPILSVPEWDLNFEVAPFIDFGKIWNDRTNQQEIRRDKLSSFGIGFLLNLGDNFDARLDWGIPLDDLGGAKPSLQENGVYFQIRYRPL